VKRVVCTLIVGVSGFFCHAQEESDSISYERQIKEIVIKLKDPISRQYSVRKMNKMDIYLNPAANADPLKAVAILPSSTNVDETANPNLRGSSADRSRIYLNGVPIINPIRFGSDNGLGGFSLFNTEIIDKQYIYASNPPLIFGNTSAGLVQIETNTKLDDEGQQYALSLSNVGFLYNKKIGRGSFLQVYGNHQFDKPFLEANKKSLPRLNHFKTIDIGANVHKNINQALSFNSFNYFINEDYGIKNSSMNFTADADARKSRFFSVNNFDYSLGESTKLRLSTLFDYTDSEFNFGTIASNIYSYQYFTSLSGKSFFNRRFSAQYGLETSFFENKYREIIPIYFFAVSEKSPSVSNKQDVDFHYVEPYVYVNYDIKPNFGVSSSVRKNIFRDKEKDFLSYQLSSHFEFGEGRQNRIILAGGSYHSYSNPTYLNRSYNLLSSKQVAFDYYYEGEKFNFSGATFYKNEDGVFMLNNYEEYDNIKTFGIELSVAIPIFKDFTLSMSNSYIDQKILVDDQKYNSQLNLKYFVKSQLIYSNPNIFTCALLFTTRPGNHFTPVHAANYHVGANDFQPVFGSPFSSVYPDYRRLDFSINKLIALNTSYIIAFLSVNNILNYNNESSTFFNENYSSMYFDYYQKRTFYIGAQIRF